MSALNLFGSASRHVKHAQEIHEARTVSPERRDEIIDFFAREVVKRDLVTPAIMFLEMNRPVSFIGSQGLLAATPVLGVFFNEKFLTELGTLMEDRSNIDRLIDRIEALNREEVRRRREEAQRRREEAAAARAARAEARRRPPGRG